MRVALRRPNIRDRGSGLVASISRRGVGGMPSHGVHGGIHGVILILWVLVMVHIDISSVGGRPGGGRRIIVRRTSGGHRG